MRCRETTLLFPAEQPNFHPQGRYPIKHWQKYNKTITALCVGKHPDLSTLGGLFSPQVDKSGCFPTQRVVIVK